MASILLVPEHHHQKPSLTHIRWIKKPRYPVHVSGKSLVHTFQKHSLADKEQSQQFHGVFYLPSTVPETLTNLPSKAASSTPSKNTQLWLHKKTWQQIPGSTHVHRHIRTHTLQFPGATVGVTTWLWATTFDFSYLSTLILTWEENTVPGMILWG